MRHLRDNEFHHLSMLHRMAEEKRMQIPVAIEPVAAGPTIALQNHQPTRRLVARVERRFP